MINKQRNSFVLRHGYSLIELIIVVGLVSMLSVAISAIVLTTIVNSNRIKTQVRVRQTGDYAIGQIQTMIRNARSVVSCDTFTNRITIRNQDNYTTLIYLQGDQIASNSGTYLTPDDTAVTNFSLACKPSDSNPRLVNISFTLGKADAGSERPTENPTQFFSSAVELRNE